ncbi:MAG: alanyl-tRNA editing protein [Acidobacteriota bacterium]|nr:alanyl-tRNA editing protein [Acidobacteriota bacterium]
MTEKIYHRDAYCREVMAIVAGRECREGRWRLRLQRTIFCPEGGGQPADQGTINDLPLLALEAEGDDIIHVVGEDPGGGQASLRLDFTRRFDHMQQHTAQHLLSQVLLRSLHAPTLSFAIGPEHSSIEIGRPAVSEDETRALEEECARLAFAALPVRVFETDDVSALHLRKAPKVRGRIRVVEIEGFDQSACGGTHVRNSAEIGPLKIVRTERVRANVRLYYAAGHRALRDHQLKHDVAQRLQRLVTQPLAAIPEHVEALLKERDELRRALKKALRREMEREAAAAAAAAGTLAVREFSGCEPADLRVFAGALMAAGKHVLAYQRSHPAHVIIGRGCGDFDLRLISSRIFALLAGKGGGSANLLEGRGGDFSKINEVLDLLRLSLPDTPGPRA